MLENTVEDSTNEVLCEQFLAAQKEITFVKGDSLINCLKSIPDMNQAIKDYLNTEEFYSTRAKVLNAVRKILTRAIIDTEDKDQNLRQKQNEFYKAITEFGKTALAQERLAAVPNASNLDHEKEQFNDQNSKADKEKTMGQMSQQLLIKLLPTAFQQGDNYYKAGDITTAYKNYHLILVTAQKLIMYSSEEKNLDEDSFFNHCDNFICSLKKINQCFLELEVTCDEDLKLWNIGLATCESIFKKLNSLKKIGSIKWLDSILQILAKNISYYCTVLINRSIKENYNSKGFLNVAEIDKKSRIYLNLSLNTSKEKKCSQNNVFFNNLESKESNSGAIILKRLISSQVHNDQANDIDIFIKKSNKNFEQALNQYILNSSGEPNKDIDDLFEYYIQKILKNYKNLNIEECNLAIDKLKEIKICLINKISVNSSLLNLFNEQFSILYLKRGDGYKIGKEHTQAIMNYSIALRRFLILFKYSYENFSIIEELCKTFITFCKDELNKNSNIERIISQRNFCIKVTEKILDVIENFKNDKTGLDKIHSFHFEFIDLVYLYTQELADYYIKQKKWKEVMGYCKEVKEIIKKYIAQIDEKIVPNDDKLKTLLNYSKEIQIYYETCLIENFLAIRNKSLNNEDIVERLISIKDFNNEINEYLNSGESYETIIFTMDSLVKLFDQHIIESKNDDRSQLLIERRNICCKTILATAKVDSELSDKDQLKIGFADGEVENKIEQINSENLQDNSLNDRKENSKRKNNNSNRIKKANKKNQEKKHKDDVEKKHKKEQIQLFLNEICRFQEFDINVIIKQTKIVIACKYTKITNNGNSTLIDSKIFFKTVVEAINSIFTWPTKENNENEQGKIDACMMVSYKESFTVTLVEHLCKIEDLIIKTNEIKKYLQKELRDLEQNNINSDYINPEETIELKLAEKKKLPAESELSKELVSEIIKLNEEQKENLKCFLRYLVCMESFQKNIKDKNLFFYGYLFDAVMTFRLLAKNANGSDKFKPYYGRNLIRHHTRKDEFTKEEFYQKINPLIRMLKKIIDFLDEEHIKSKSLQSIGKNRNALFSISNLNERVNEIFTDDDLFKLEELNMWLEKFEMKKINEERESFSEEETKEINLKLKGLLAKLKSFKSPIKGFENHIRLMIHSLIIKKDNQISHEIGHSKEIFFTSFEKTILPKWIELIEKKAQAKTSYSPVMGSSPGKSRF